MIDDPPEGDRAARPGNFTGYFLCASELLLDPNFFRTVVMLAQQDSMGALGLVVNRPTDGCMGDLFSALRGTELGDKNFSWGGPVQQEQLFVLRREDARIPEPFPMLRPVPGLVFEPLTQIFFDFLQNTPASEHPEYRIFAGYAGWETGQLDRELDEGAWYWVDGDAPTVFSPHPQSLYEKVLSRKGPLYEIIAKTGIKISVN